MIHPFFPMEAPDMNDSLKKKHGFHGCELWQVNSGAHCMTTRYWLPEHNVQGCTCSIIKI